MDRFLRLFPRSGLAKAEFRNSFAGIRQLPYAPGKSYSAVTRHHIVHDHRGDGAAGLISLIGGKLTTAASVARDVARKLGARSAEPANAFAAPAQEEALDHAVRESSQPVTKKARISP